MKTIIFLASLIAISSLNSSNAQDYEAFNNAIGTPGGTRFSTQIGLDYAIQTLDDASSTFWYIFETNISDRNNIPLITLTILNTNSFEISTNVNASIFINADYIAKFSGDIRTEFTGIVYHEIARVRQSNGGGQAPIGLLTGVADFFRLKAGYASRGWGEDGPGGRWDEGYHVTARFLDYCNNKYNHNLLVYLNDMMKSGYSDGFFETFTGKSIVELWNEYVAQFGYGV